MKCNATFAIHVCFRFYLFPGMSVASLMSSCASFISRYKTEIECSPCLLPLKTSSSTSNSNSPKVSKIQRTLQPCFFNSVWIPSIRSLSVPWNAGAMIVCIGLWKQVPRLSHYSTIRFLVTAGIPTERSKSVISIRSPPRFPHVLSLRLSYALHTSP